MEAFQVIAIVVAAAVTAFLSTPLVIRLAKRIGAIDRPNARKVSEREAMPLLGGLAVALGCVVGLSLAFLICDVEGLSNALPGFAAGSTILIGVGVWDDRFDLRPLYKFGFQLLAAGLAIEAGFRFDLFSNFVTRETIVVPAWLLWPVSLLWIVGVTNAMNLIDGLDGLSSGVGAIIAGTLTVLCWQGEQWVGAVVGFVLFGALVGYLPFNFPPARIFLGDTGSLFIGYALALLALEGYRKTALFTFMVPLMALAIPLLDTALSILRRLRSGRGVFSADRLHMHHRLLHREGSHRSAVLMLYFLTACFCMIAVSFAQIDGWIAFVYLGAVVAVTFRLLRNLDAFSLEFTAEAPIPPDASGDDGEGDDDGPEAAQ